MNVPGSNLLATALTVICPQSFQLFRYQGKTINAIGLDVHVYDAPVDLRGSIQAVGSEVYGDRGLDFQKQYIDVWVEANVSDLFRARASDQIAFNGRRYQVVDENDWFPIDGWDKFLAVLVVTP